MSSATPRLGPSKQAKSKPPEDPAPKASLLAQLSPEQREVAQRIIESPGSNFAVSAPPGVGKTFTMTTLARVLLGPEKCAGPSRVKVFVVAPTNLALMQWSKLHNDPNVKLTTAAALVGRGVKSPKVPPTTAVFDRKCGDLQGFVMGRAIEPEIDLVLILWDEFWNTPAEDVDNGFEIFSRVLQTTCTTIVMMGDPVQHKPVDGANPLLSSPFHELSRANTNMLPGLARRPLLKNLMTIPGESRRVCDAPDDVVELIAMAGHIEKLLRAGNLRQADREIQALQSCTAGLVAPPGKTAVYLTARRDQQWKRQLEALKPLTLDGAETLITGTPETPVEERTCIVVNHEHKLTRYVQDALIGGIKSSAKLSLPNGLRGKVVKLGRTKKKGKPGRKRRKLEVEEPVLPYDIAFFQPNGDQRVYAVPVTAVTTVTASTTHGAQGITMPDQVKVIFDCLNARSVYRTRADMVAAFVVALSRAKDAPTVIINYEPGLLLQVPDDEEEASKVETQVAEAFMATVQRLTAGKVPSIVPKKVRLKTPCRASLQRQLDAAFKNSPMVQIAQWNGDTKTATLESGLTVQAI